MGQKHFGLQHLQLVLTTFSEGNSAFGTGWIFNTNPHSSFWYWRKKQKQTTTELKICHNSDLKITKCTSGFSLVENGLWKTLWKVWKSTLKRGVSAGLLHVLHRVFNLWKKQDPFTTCIQGFLWKTSPPGNRTDILPGSWQHFFIPGRGVWGGSGKFSGRKNRNSMAKKVRLCYTSRWINIGFCHKNGKLSDAGSVFP